MFNCHTGPCFISAWTLVNCLTKEGHNLLMHFVNSWDVPRPSSICVQYRFCLHSLPKLETLSTWEGVWRFWANLCKISSAIGYHTSHLSQLEALVFLIRRWVHGADHKWLWYFQAKDRKGAENSLWGLCRLLWWDWLGTWLSERH